MYLNDRDVEREIYTTLQDKDDLHPEIGKALIRLEKHIERSQWRFRKMFPSYMLLYTIYMQ